MAAATAPNCNENAKYPKGGLLPNSPRICTKVLQISPAAENSRNLPRKKLI
jgi:hypothetical protein